MKELRAAGGVQRKVEAGVGSKRAAGRELMMDGINGRNVVTVVEWSGGPKGNFGWELINTGYVEMVVLPHPHS